MVVNMMSKYEDVLKLRQKILSQLRETKSLTQLQADGIIMSSDFWLSQESIKKAVVTLRELSEDEKLIEKYI